VLIHVDTENNELLVNNRFAYVSVSRGQYDAQIYTDDRSELARDLSRDLTQRTAIPSQEQEPTVLKIEPAAAQQAPEQTHDHGLGNGNWMTLGKLLGSNTTLAAVVLVAYEQ
jgi:hypothetical protein